MLPIQTNRFELQDFRPTDEAAVHVYASDPLVTQHLWWGPNTQADTRAFLGTARRQAKKRPRRDLVLAIVSRASRELIGGCSLLVRRSLYREYEIGYCLRRDWWGKGYGMEIVESITTFGFSRLEAHRIYALVMANARAGSVIRGMGGGRSQLRT